MKPLTKSLLLLIRDGFVTIGLAMSLWNKVPWPLWAFVVVCCLRFTTEDLNERMEKAGKVRQ